MFTCLSVVLFLGVSAMLMEAVPYDPLQVEKGEVVSEKFEVRDAARDRVLPVKVYFPESKKAAPVVIFSHGLGGSCDNNSYLGNHWAKRGYMVVFVQHPGSDESVWKDAPKLSRMVKLKAAASVQSYMDRGKDVPALIDALEVWNVEKGHALEGRLDLGHIGMSGHSFGAKTTQSMAGESMAGGRLSFEEKRIDAAVMMSPSIPKRGDPAKAFGKITIPCLLMTGTLDSSPIGDSKPEDRLKVFPNLTSAPAWQVIFDGATHMSFGDRDLRGKTEEGTRYHKAILALTTAFWDAHLRSDKAAKQWLNGEGAKGVLDEADTWDINARVR